MPRTFAIGDIHGCDTALTTLLDAVAPTPADTVVVLGDVVDRGPGSRQCLERLLALRDACRTVFIMGNHEEMMLDALGRGDWFEDWTRYGGDATLDSYGSEPGLVDPEHPKWLRTWLAFWESPTTIFVHAGVDATRPLEKQEVVDLRWQRLSGAEQPHRSGKRIICGHTSQKDGIPKTMPGWVCIDTCAHGGGWLTALDVVDDLVWQANDFGVSRGPIPLDEIAKPFPAR